jgi:ribosomal protein L11 methyltransferase
VIRLALRVRRADAELVLAELLELAPGGVEESSEGDVVEYAVYGAPGEVPELPDLQAAAGDALVEIHTEEIADDWPERWKAFHQPIDVAGRLYVRPPWEPAPPAGDGRIDIVIDPGQAFGTGSHHTTRLCLELLLELDLGAAPAHGLLDLGCGSGVLAIAAAKLGFGPVSGLDHEPESVAATAANAAVNRVEVEVARSDLRRDPIPAAPVIVANLLRPLLLTVAERIERPPGVLIASGLLRHEADEVAAAFAARGLREADRREAGDWAALLLRS